MKAPMTLHPGFTSLKRVGMIVLLPVMTLAGCASTPESTTLPLAKSALETSNEASLNRYAPLELKIARDNIAAAEAAAKKKEHDQAERFAQKALVNIKLATAKVDMKKSEATAKQIEQNIQTLREEIKR